MKNNRLLSFVIGVIVFFSTFAVCCGVITASGAEKNYTVDGEKTLSVIFDGKEQTLYEKKMMCDINGDGKFNSADAAHLLKIAARKIQPPADISRYDLDEDGSLKAGDARLALRYSAKLDRYYCFEDESVPDGFLAPANGDGSYYFTGAGVLVTGIRTIDGGLYYFDPADGLSRTGLRSAGGRTYYFGEDGKAQNGRITVDGKEYFFEGFVAVNGLRTEDGATYYYVNGEKQTGWQQVDGARYYIGADGRAVNGKTTVDGTEYLFENGVAANGFRSENGNRYYYKNGVKQTDWQQIDGSWYFFGADGVMRLGKITIGGLSFDFGSDGKSKTGRTGSQPRIAVIGDSIVASLAIYLSPDNVDFYGKVSLHADTIFTKKISGSSRYIIDEIRDRGYDKVVVLLGVNDLTYSDGAWGEMYRRVIRGAKERAPGAEIVAHGITPVNDSRARSHGYGDTTMALVRNKNGVIADIAAQEGVRYIDAVSVLTDSSGQLPYGAANDGIHFGSKYCNIWLDWLMKTI